MDELRFRFATFADVPRLHALVESAYRGESGQRGWTTETHLLDGRRTDVEELEALIRRPDSRVLLAERGSALLACCHLERRGDACYFGMFAVAPDLQNGGVGKQVLAEAERFAAQDWRCREMQMTVIDLRTELMAFYERRGYRRTGEHSPFPYGDARFGLPKRDDLRFEQLVKALPGA